MSTLRITPLVAICLAAALPTSPPLIGVVHAAPVTWIGGNADWDTVAVGKWNPADEPDDNDEAIFNAANSVDLANVSESIQALTMSGGIDLDTSGNDMAIDGLVDLSGTGTNFIIGGAASSVQADSVDVNADARLAMSGGTLNVVENSGSGVLNVLAGGTLSGAGVINFNDVLGSPTDVINLSGVLSASATGLIIIGNPPAGTLTLNAASANARFDLDASAGAVVNAFRNQTLEINGTLSDGFSAEMNLFHNSTIDIRDPWTLNTGAISVDNGFVPGSTFPFFPAIPADVAFLSGGGLTQTGGTINVIDEDGTLQFDAPFTQNGGTVTNNGTVVFGADSTIAAGANFAMPTASSSVTVNSGATVNVDQADFNADGGGTSTNLMTVNSDGLLDIDMGAGGDETFDNVVTLNGGELDVTTASGGWTIERTLNLAHTSGSSAVIDGDAVTIGNDSGASDANVNVSGTGSSQINADVTFNSDADVNIAAGATLELNGNATFRSVGFAANAEFTGGGILELDGPNTEVLEAATIDMPSGRVDLDGTGGILTSSPQTLTVGGALTSNLVLNVTAIDSTDNSFGKNNLLAGPDTIVLNNFSSLIVNLTDPNEAWTLNANAVLDINAIGGNLGGSGIGGSDFNMAGTATISGNSIWTARTDISGTATIAAAGSLNLRGGDLVDANRLAGGTIEGDGSLRALEDQALHGFGVIEADVEFANNTELRADDGTLTVTGSIVDVGVLGTADDDGVLDIPAAWNTAANIDRVEMRGGEIRGGAITNDNADGVNGFGLLASRVVNNSSINAVDGALIVETAGNNNDWDGAGGTGALKADGGDLEIRDDASFAFTGSVTADDGDEVFASGFELQFEPTSSLTLRGGTFRSSTATRFGGSLAVQNVGQSSLAGENFRFESGSATSLAGDLHLANSGTIVEVGAGFSGGGSLIIDEGGALRLLDGVADSDLAVLIENKGTLRLGAGAAAGQVQGVDYEQHAAGAWDLELGGIGANDFDRFNLSGLASLDGTLALALIDGYVPTLGDTLNILSATGGVVGAFANVNQPAGMTDGLLFDVLYTPTLVQLTVIEEPAFTADFDADGDVDGDDLAEWRAGYGPGNDADADADGDSDGADFLTWQRQYGSGVEPPPIASVPEPSTLLLAAAAGAMGVAVGRHRRS